MANARVVVVVASVMFALYWGGILQAATRTALSFLFLPFSSFFRIKYVDDPLPTEEHRDPEPLLHLKDSIGDALEEDQKNVATHLMDVVTMMENLVSNSDLDSMTDVELEETFGKIYDMFPLMDTVFTKALDYEGGVSINPRTDYHETHRRYEALRNTLEKKRKEKKVKKLAAKEQTIDEDEAVVTDDEGVQEGEL